MLCSWRFNPQLMHLVPLIYPRYSCFHMGNYDGNTGGCCKVQTKCVQKTVCGPVRPIPNRCNTRVDEDSILKEAYPQQLMEILKRDQDNDDCELFRHDVCHYQPSDKNRRYQRTWCECPRIWLRPKPTCCFDREYYLPIERRPKSPPQPDKSSAEMYAFQMEQICKYTSRMGKEPRLKCQVVKIPQNCEKVRAPFPSFSECNPNCIPKFCPTECACKLKPNLCDMWKLYHHNDGLLKKCTEALVKYCPYKHRARPLL